MYRLGTWGLLGPPKMFAASKEAEDGADGAAEISTP